MTTTEEYLLVPEVAERLRVHVNTVRRWLREGTLQGVKPGGDKSGYRISVQALEDLLSRGGPGQFHPKRKQQDAA